MTKLRFAFPLLAIALMFTSSGCLISRKIVEINDHPSKNVTLVETHDKFFGGKQVDQFWQCADQNGTLVCKQSCGGKTNLACLIFVGGQPTLR